MLFEMNNTPTRPDSPLHQIRQVLMDAFIKNKEVFICDTDGMNITVGFHGYKIGLIFNFPDLFCSRKTEKLMTIANFVLFENPFDITKYSKNNLTYKMVVFNEVRSPAIISTFNKMAMAIAYTFAFIKKGQFDKLTIKQ